jgi:flavorubredoxin
MAEAVAEGLRALGCEVDLFNTDEGRFDVARFAHATQRLRGIRLARPFGSYVAGGLKQFMDDHYIADVRKGMKGLKNKPYALFYSHGGGGRVREAMASLFSRVGTRVRDPVGSRGYPSPDVLAQCRSLGQALAEAVLR